MTEQETIEKVVAKLEGKKVRVTYYASETVHYETIIEATTREEADEIYYNGGESCEVIDSEDFRTYDITEEEL